MASFFTQLIRKDYIMTAVAGAPSGFSFNKSMFSDPNMRPHLKAYYNEKYDALRESLTARQKAEESGAFPTTIQTEDGKTLKAISASKMAEAIPSFEKWLDVQQNGLSPFDFAAQKMSMLEHARESVRHIQDDLNTDGSLVTHEGGGVLQQISERADKLNLYGQAKIAYIEREGAAELSKRYSNLDVTKYADADIPTKREFAQKWYPHHDVDAAYSSMMNEAEAFLEQQEAFYEKQMQSLNEMRAFLIQSMEEAQNAQRSA